MCPRCDRLLYRCYDETKCLMCGYVNYASYTGTSRPSPNPSDEWIPIITSGARVPPRVTRLPGGAAHYKTKSWPKIRAWIYQQTMKNPTELIRLRIEWLAERRVGRNGYNGLHKAVVQGVSGWPWHRWAPDNMSRIGDVNAGFRAATGMQLVDLRECLLLEADTRAAKKEQAHAR